METRHEACSAEGQPRNILKGNPNRFAARCPALSRRCHYVIHSCYAFSDVFAEFSRVMPAPDPGIGRFSSEMDRRIKPGDDTVEDASPPRQG
jgi:hypothetical protein